ncbi:unnamed protein product [Acanthoscelides obtectus]|uniref:NADH dehydrogenase [ubiquinone] 1 alpha subcomplex subunit 10, mitochondrial n=1 Tax=Acanthoscelides obtectus TaxID=200917 RepID=A0A9P0NY30_ACAOB|nr:unnamed protein product [Acanthoscelides obtectus]CAK1668113.1 NADH dehydrogenase [ubiquinone] 1 alpha subcomplex subunit 10, mitochondrial [Acanthoscelides obtectus]
MASFVRISFCRLAGRGGTILSVNSNVGFVRSITSKTTRAAEKRPPKPAPWNYHEKSYTLLNYLFDKTSARFDDNSMVLVVEGPIAAGKTKVAKQLAAELDMLYLPEANLGMNYINNYGYDLRKLDPILPEMTRSFDVPDFLRNPKHKLTARFQIQQLITRLSQYVDALAHVFSTGQGVVLDRCVYSDFVFAEAMYNQGYLSKKAYKKYYEFRDNPMIELLRPHLIIYLDVPVPKVIENVKKRGISFEKGSPVINQQYLSVMEKHYMQSYLKEMSKHSELLVYDWSEEGDVEIVVEDIERINFNYDYQDQHLKDWDFRNEEDYAVLRHKFTSFVL